MRQFNDKGGQYETRGMIGAKVQHYTDWASNRKSSNTYKGEGNSQYFSSRHNQLLNWFPLPFLELRISAIIVTSAIMITSTFLILSSIALGISATAVNPLHHSPANSFTLGFFGTPEIRDSINLKVKGKVSFNNFILV
jgi:hypothetical protein